MTIVVSGVPTSRKTPGTYLETYPGTSGAGGTANKDCVLVGQILATGSMAAGEVTACENLDAAVDLAGQGSECHLMAKGFFAANPGGSLYLGALTAGTTASTRTITFGGVAAGADCTYKVFVNGNEYSYSITNGETVAAVATAVIAGIQAQDWYGDLPVTVATGGAGIVTFTTKNLGPQSQWAEDPIYQDDSNLVTITATLAASVTGASGGNEPTVTAVVTTLGAADYDYIGWSTLNSVATAAIEAYINTQVGPLVGFRQQSILVSPDSYANSKTTAQTNCNHRRIQVAFSQTDRETWCETVGRMVGLRALTEDGDPAAPYRYKVLPGYRVHHNTGSYVSPTVRENCLNNSLTPIVVYGGDGCVARSITSYSLAGAMPDYSCLDTSEVTIVDYAADDMATACEVRFAGKKCAADYTDPTNTPPGVVTPKMVIDLMYERLKIMQASGIVEDVEPYKAQIQASKDAVAAGRINAEYPVPTIEGMYINAFNVRGA